MKHTPTPRQLIMPSADQYNATIFEYHDLEEAVNQYYSVEFDTIEPSLQEHGDALWHKLTEDQAQRFLPVLTLMIQSALSHEQQQHWTRQYSLATSRIYGKPDAREAARLAAVSYQKFKTVADKHNVKSATIDNLLAVYRSIGVDTDNIDQAATDETELLVQIKSILQEHYADIYAVVDNEYPDNAHINAHEVQRLYVEMLRLMARYDEIWGEWGAILHPGTQMSVSPERRQVRIGRHMPPQSPLRVKSLFTHEVLVHAARAVGGLPYTEQLAYGMPGYSEAEEGLGVLMEAAIDGQMPHRVADRYIDIALALGQFDRPAMSRPELFELVRARTKLRQLAAGTTTDDDTTERAVWQHVNRIYRGTLGNEIVGVMTRDVIYYHGYKTMADYLEGYRARDLRQAVRFVLSSKINPVDQAHRAYFHAVKFNINPEEN